MLAYVDASVLATPLPRTVLYLASAYEECDFSLTFSPYVEAEADRALKPGARKVSELRERWLWQVTPDHPDANSLNLDDTNWKDKPVLAAAVHAGACCVITGNVRHFGERDLARFGMYAIHPGLFLAHRLTAETYAAILGMIAAGRMRNPRTVETIHVEQVAVELPDLFQRFQNIFGPINMPNVPNLPHLVVRGVWDNGGSLTDINPSEQ